MAPYEADPVLANLFLTGTAHAVLSRDSDLFTYGLTWLVDKIQLKADQRSFSIKYLKPLPQFSLAYERLDKLEPNFDYLSLSFLQRCALAAVLGTDYSGSGLTGMSLVKFSRGLAKAGGDFENFLGNLYRTALSPAWHLIRCSVISQLYHPIGVTDGSLVYLPAGAGQKASTAPGLLLSQLPSHRRFMWSAPISAPSIPLWRSPEAASSRRAQARRPLLPSTGSLRSA
jgi:hypothetical protein